MCHILILKVCKRDHLNFAILRCCFQAIGRKSRSVNIFFHSDQTWQFHFCQLTYIDEILSDSNKIFIYISDFTNPCCTWDSKVLCHGRSYLSSVTVRSLLSTNDHVIITNGCNSLSQCIGGCQHVRTCERIHVYVLTNGIFASAGTAEIAEVRNVPVRTTHLGRVAAVNALSREIAAGGVTLDEAEHCLAEARRIPFPKGKTQLLAGMSGTACFALIFGGTIRSALAAAAAGLIVSGYLLLCEKKNLSNGFRKISAAALITLVCILGCHLLDTEASHAIIGALMILTPGIAFTMGIRDFVQGDYLSGTIRMIDALLIAASIAIGTGLVLSLTSILTGVTVV